MPSTPEFAQDHVTLWLVNDQRYLNLARPFAAGDETGDRLRVFVTAAVWHGTEARDAGERHTLQLVRNSMARDDFDAIDWAAVRAEVLSMFESEG